MAAVYPSARLLATPSDWRLYREELEEILNAKDRSTFTELFNQRKLAGHSFPFLGYEGLWPELSMWSDEPTSSTVLSKEKNGQQLPITDPAELRDRQFAADTELAKWTIGHLAIAAANGEEAGSFPPEWNLGALVRILAAVPTTAPDDNTVSKQEYVRRNPFGRPGSALQRITLAMLLPWLYKTSNHLEVVGGDDPVAAYVRCHDTKTPLDFSSGSATD